MSSPWFESDEQLLEELGRALADRSPDSEPVEMLMTGYDLVMIDSAEATVTFDPAIDEMAATRSAATGVRMLTFTVDETDIDVEVADGWVVGRVSPPRSGLVFLDEVHGTVRASLDGLGGFEFELHSPTTFRIRLEDAEGGAISTPWIDGPHPTRAS